MRAPETVPLSTSIRAEVSASLGPWNAAWPEASATVQ